MGGIGRLLGVLGGLGLLGGVLRRGLRIWACGDYRLPLKMMCRTRLKAA